MMFLFPLFYFGRTCDLWWLLLKSHIFPLTGNGPRACVCVFGPDVLQLICVCGCVTEQWGFLTEGKIEGKKQRKTDTKKLPYETETVLHLDPLDYTACSAAKPVKILFPLFLSAFMSVCACAYDNAVTWGILSLQIRWSYPGTVRTCMYVYAWWMSQSSLELLGTDPSAVRGGHRLQVNIGLDFIKTFWTEVFALNWKVNSQMVTTSLRC